MDAMDRAKFTLEIAAYFKQTYSFTPNASMAAAQAAVEALIKSAERASEQAEKNRKILRR